MQRPIELREALSLLPIVGNFCSTRGAQISRYRPVLVIEGENEVEFADARQILENQVDIRGASTHDTKTSLNTMTKPHYEAISILEKSALLWELRSTSFLSAGNVAWLSCVGAASGEKSRVVLGHGNCKRCAIVTFTFVWVKV